MFQHERVSPFRSWHATQTLSGMKNSNLVPDNFMVCPSEESYPSCACTMLDSAAGTSQFSHQEWAHTGVFLRQVYPDVMACAQGMEWSSKLMKRSAQLSLNSAQVMSGIIISSLSGVLLWPIRAALHLWLCQFFLVEKLTKKNLFLKLYILEKKPWTNKWIWAWGKIPKIAFKNHFSKR